MQKKNSVRTDGADRRPNILARNEDLVTSRDNTPSWFTGLRITAEWIVVNGLLNFEAPYWFRGISSFVNVGRHATVYY